ncbi:MAG: polysaccharide deacetylase family protein [Candidatus Woesearchaeota archaeon]
MKFKIINNQVFWVLIVGMILLLNSNFALSKNICGAGQNEPCAYDIPDDTGGNNYPPGLITEGSSGSNQIAITLDACSGDYDQQLIDYLKREQIPATLFLNSNWIAQNMDVARQLAQDPLFEIENHGTKHIPCTILDDYVYRIKATANEQEISTEILTADASINALRVKAKYYRPGTGMADPACIQVANQNGYQVVDWTISGDGGATLSAEGVKSQWLRATSGSIIISHMNHPEGQTAEGVALAVPELKSQGYEFVKLSQMLTGAAVTSSLPLANTGINSNSRVMIIGDSHTSGTTYGSTLYNSFKGTGAQVWNYGVGGASPITWVQGTCDGIKTNGVQNTCTLVTIDASGTNQKYLSGNELNPYSLTNLKSTINPDIIIISLGSNMINGNLNQDLTINLAQTASSGGTTCYWVGPPKSTLSGMEDVALKLNQIVSPCIFIDSLPLSDPSKLADSVHYTSTGATEWAQRVFQQITSGTAASLGTPAGVRGSALATPTGSLTSGGTSSTSGCLTSTCREIDQVWVSISSLVGSKYAGQVWDPQLGWVTQKAGYVSPATSGSFSSSNLPSTGNSGNYCGVATVGSTEMRTLLDTIAWAEGANYNTIVGAETFTDFSTHPKKRVYIPRIKDYSTAAGRYQFMDFTYDDLKGKNLAFVNGFYPKDQDEAALYLINIRNRVSDNDVLNSISNNNFIPIWDKLAPTWASIPESSTGTSHYGQGGRSVSQLDGKFKECYEIQKAKG